MALPSYSVVVATSRPPPGAYFLGVVVSRIKRSVTTAREWSRQSLNVRRRGATSQEAQGQEETSSRSFRKLRVPCIPTDSDCTSSTTVSALTSPLTKGVVVAVHSLSMIYFQHPRASYIEAILIIIRHFHHIECASTTFEWSTSATTAMTRRGTSWRRYPLEGVPT